MSHKCLGLKCYQLNLKPYHALSRTYHAVGRPVNGQSLLSWLMGRNPGLSVMAKGKDFETLVKSDVFYFPSFGKLVLEGINEAQNLSG